MGEKMRKKCGSVQRQGIEPRSARMKIEKEPKGENKKRNSQKDCINCVLVNGCEQNGDVQTRRRHAHQDWGEISVCTKFETPEHSEVVFSHFQFGGMFPASEPCPHAVLGFPFFDCF
jgi:hypothetical protein